jgi:hypothetical protein
MFELGLYFIGLVNAPLSHFLILYQEVGPVNAFWTKNMLDYGKLCA